MKCKLEGSIFALPLYQKMEELEMKVNYAKLGIVMEDCSLALIDLADMILTRIDEYTEDTLDDVLWEAMDSGMIYTKDQWTMVEEFCTPFEVNFDYAWEMFESYLRKAIASGVLEED